MHQAHGAGVPGGTPARTLRFSDHARDRMNGRRITEDEVAEALAAADPQAPAAARPSRAAATIQDVLDPSARPVHVDRTGRTASGRTLRITHPEGDPEHVISVVALDVDQEQEVEPA